MLSNEVARYVALNRSLGLKFNNEDQILRSFAIYAQAHGDQHMRADRIFTWCRSASSPVRARTFYAAIRRFCVFLHAENPQHAIPPAGAFGRGRCPRPAPHLLDAHQVRALMTAALELPPKGSISPHTYHHLFGLLAATGLRISEALALKRDDLCDDGLIVRKGKFGKSRLLPIHMTTRQAFDRYLTIRDRLNAGGDDLFVVTTGRLRKSRLPIKSFGGSPTRWEYAILGAHQARACMTCGIRLPFDHWKPARPIAPRSPLRCSHSALISATPKSPIPTGISKQRRFCCAALLKPASSSSTEGQHDGSRSLPLRLPA